MEHAVLLVSVFSVMLGYGVTLTVLPYYTSEVHRLSGIGDESLAAHVGLLTGVYALAQLISGPAVGRLADRWGRRPVAIVGLVTAGVAQASFGLVTSLWWLYVLRVLGGMAVGLLTVAAAATIADRSHGVDRTRGMAQFGTAVSLGIVGGPLLGSVLSRSSIVVAGTEIGGYSVPFLAAGLFALAAAALVTSFVTESYDPSRVSFASSTRPGRAVYRLRAALALVAAGQFGLALFESTFVLYARTRFAFSAKQVTLAFLVCGVVMAILQPFAAGPLRRFVPSSSQITVGFLAMALGVAALLSTEAVVMVAVALLAAGTALITPNLAVLVAERSSDTIGTSLGMKNSASSLGQFLGPVIGGLLLAWRMSSAYAVGALVLVAAAVGASQLSRQRGLPSE